MPTLITAFNTIIGSGGIGVVSFSSWPLLNDLLGLNSGGNDITYTRNGSNATVRDFEGILKQLPAADAPPFVGARIVENLVSNSEMSTANGWLLSQIDSETTGEEDAFGGSTAVRYSRASIETDPAQVNDSVVSFLGEFLTNSVYIKISTADLARPGALIEVADGSVTAINWIDVTADLIADTWVRICTGAGVVESTSKVLAVRWSETDDSAGLMELSLCGAMTEDVTGHIDTQNPSDFIDSATQYAFFNTKNGNTLVSNIVASVAGDAISASVLKGMLIEKEGTNSCLRSNDFDTTWVLSGTCGKAQDGVQMGLGKLWTLDSNGGAATDGYEQTIAVTGKTVTAISFFVKDDSSPISHAKLTMTGGTTPITPQLKLTWNGSGVPTITNGAVAFTTIKVTATLVSGVYLVEATYDDSGDATGNTSAKIGLFPDFSTTGLTSQFGYMQFEKAAKYSTSYIPTTTGAVNRAIADADLPWLNSGGTVSDFAIFLELDWKADRDVTGENKFFLDFNGTANSNFDLQYRPTSSDFRFTWDGGSSVNAGSSGFVKNVDKSVKIAIRQTIANGISIILEGSENGTNVTANAKVAMSGILSNHLLHIGSILGTGSHCDMSIKTIQLLTDPADITITALEALTS